MRNADYWKARSEYTQDQLMAIGEAYYEDLSQHYKLAYERTQEKIDRFYARFADNNEMSFADAKKLLTSSERKAYQMELEDYIEKGRTLNYSDEWAKELENASTAYRVTRLQMLQNQMRQQIEELHSKYNTGLGSTLEKVYEDGYYRTLYELQKGIGMGVDFTILDTETIKAIAAKPWTPDNRTFSERIWGETTKLVNYLNTDLGQAMISGTNPRDIAKDVQRRFDVSKRNAETLVLSETAYFSSLATQNSYNEMDVSRYEFLATLNERTCEVCGALDGKVFDTKDYQPGLNAPIAHARCRCTTIPYFDDLGGERWAKNEGDKAYKVAGDIKFKDWYRGNVLPVAVRRRNLGWDFSDLSKPRTKAERYLESSEYEDFYKEYQARGIADMKPGAAQKAGLKLLYEKLDEFGYDNEKLAGRFAEMFGEEISPKTVKTKKDEKPVPKETIVKKETDKGQKGSNIDVLTRKLDELSYKEVVNMTDAEMLKSFKQLAENNDSVAKYWTELQRADSGANTRNVLRKIYKEAGLEFDEEETIKTKPVDKEKPKSNEKNPGKNPGTARDVNSTNNKWVDDDDDEDFKESVNDVLAKIDEYNPNILKIAAEKGKVCTVYVGEITQDLVKIPGLTPDGVGALHLAKEKKIVINQKDYRNRIKASTSDTNGGWVVAGGLNATIAHEIGHAINSISWSSGETAIEAVRGRYNLTRPEFGKRISGYAATNAAESFAEAFCDIIINGNKAKRESVELTDEFFERIGAK